MIDRSIKESLHGNTRRAETREDEANKDREAAIDKDRRKKAERDGSMQVNEQKENLALFQRETRVVAAKQERKKQNTKTKEEEGTNKKRRKKERKRERYLYIYIDI